MPGQMFQVVYGLCFRAAHAVSSVGLSGLSLQPILFRLIFFMVRVLVEVGLRLAESRRGFR